MCVCECVTGNDIKLLPAAIFVWNCSRSAAVDRFNGSSGCSGRLVLFGAGYTFLWTWKYCEDSGKFSQESCRDFGFICPWANLCIIVMFTASLTVSFGVVYTGSLWLRHFTWIINTYIFFIITIVLGLQCLLHFPTVKCAAYTPIIVSVMSSCD